MGKLKKNRSSANWLKVHADVWKKQTWLARHAAKVLARLEVLGENTQD